MITPAAANDIILSIREQIPDVTDGDDAGIDGRAFSLNTLIRWINDAGRQMCAKVNLIQDWYGLQSVTGQDVYELPQYITTVEQAWYDLLPMTRAPEFDSIFVSKVSGRSWWFGPHSVHATPRLHAWPAPSRTGGATTLNGAISSTVTALTLTTANVVNTYGYLLLGPTGGTQELVRYANLTTTAVSNMLRGQGGTTAAAWASGAAVTEANIFFKCFRLPVPLTSNTSIIEIPQGLWPIIELYVLSKVRGKEQEHEVSMALRKEFNDSVNELAGANMLKGLTQGIQVRVGSAAPALFNGRIYIP